MSIQIVGEWEYEFVQDESDYYIPFSVSWWPRKPTFPLSMMITGVEGGYVELKVDPDTGGLLEVIAIITPPLLAEDPRPARVMSDVREGKSARLSRSLWPQACRPDSWNVIRVAVQDLALYQAADVAVLRFSQEPIVRWLGDRHVVIGVSKDGALATVETNLNMNRRASARG